MRTEELVRSLKQTLRRVWELMELAEAHAVALPSFEARLSVESMQLEGRPGKTVSSWYFDRHSVRAHRTHTELKDGKPCRVRHLPALELGYPDEADGLEWLMLAKKLDRYLEQGRSEPLRLEQIKGALARTEGRWGERALKALRASLSSVAAPHWLMGRFRLPSRPQLQPR